jgi:hypothetical protein
MGAVESCLQPCLGLQHRRSTVENLYGAYGVWTGGLLPIGSAVGVYGLGQASHHNGREGTIHDYDAKALRYRCGLPDGTLLRIKRGNVLQLLTVEVADLANRAELNGSFGKVYGIDAWTGRYQVRVQDVMIALAARNVIVPNGARVRITGLHNARQWNGHDGLCREYDRSSKRYTIQVGLDELLRVKLENVQL